MSDACPPPSPLPPLPYPLEPPASRFRWLSERVQPSDLAVCFSRRGGRFSASASCQSGCHPDDDVAWVVSYPAERGSSTLRDPSRRASRVCEGTQT